MTYFLIISCVMGGWAMLRLLGTERSQMIKDLESQLRLEQKQQEQLAAQNNAPPAPAADAKGPSGKKH